MSKQYGLWCECTSSLTEGGWVLDNDNEVVTYPSESAAKRDLKQNFVATSYEIKEYNNDCRPRARSKRRK
jgi:hypothetical protein